MITVGTSMPVRTLISASSSMAVIRSARASWGLHLSKRLNKDAVSGRAQYRSRG